METSQCSVCHEDKPLGEFYWQKDKAKPHCWCKACYRDWHRRRYVPKVPVSDTAQCQVCGETFTLKQRKPTQFCSMRCKNQARIRTERELRRAHTESKPCEQCGGTLTFIPGRRSRTKYCSDACQQAALRAKLTPEHRSARRFLYQYGITVQDRDRLLSEQGGGCAICGTTDPGRKGWAMDHDHSCCAGNRSCGKCLRGLLCGRCNLAIGLLQDEPNRARGAAHYLEHPPAPSLLSKGEICRS